MKLKYLFLTFIAMLALMTSCDDEETMTLLDEVRVSSSYVSIPVEGGSTSITVTTQDRWTVEKVTTDKDAVEWLTISSTSGNAGESELTFTAPSAIDGRTAEVLIINWHEIQTNDSIIIKKTTQRINVIQGLAQISEATVAEAKAAPDGKTLRISGVVTNISNTLYGNWNLTDETGELYIYGTLDEKGGTKNFLSHGLEVGDEVTIEGPKGSYNGSPQMVNVMVMEIRKSLITVDSVENEMLPIEGGEFVTYLSVKGQGVSVDIPEDAKSWLSISSIQSAGENAVVKFKVDANNGGDRGTTIIFRTTDGAKFYSTETTLSQKGAIIEATIAEFIAAPVGDTQYRLTGVITNINAKYNNNINIRDFSGETYVYRLDLGEKVYKLGDIVTVVGKRGEYNGHQLVNGVLESVISVTPATIAEMLNKPDSNTDYYMVSGEITEIVNAVYGNVDLKDGGSEIHMRGFYRGYGAFDDYRKNFLADKGIVVGDRITIITTKGSYNGVAQLNNGIYFSHVSAQ